MRNPSRIARAARRLGLSADEYSEIARGRAQEKAFFAGFRGWDEPCSVTRAWHAAAFYHDGANQRGEALRGEHPLIPPLSEIESSVPENSLRPSSSRLH